MRPSSSASSGPTAPGRPPPSTCSLPSSSRRAARPAPALCSLADPPAALPRAARRSLWELIRQLRRASGLTVFLTTHYVEEAEPCDRVAVLDGGRLVALGAPAELKRAAGATTLEGGFLARTRPPLAQPSAA